MQMILRLIAGWRWPLLAILVSAGMLAAAHGFERFAHLYPCPLCLKQREVYWAVIAMALTGLILWRLKPTQRFLAAFNALIGLAFVTGALVAAYHMGVEYGWFPAPGGCSAGADTAAIMGALDIDRPVATASCSDAPWHFLGLSMAAWNAVVSLGLAATSFIAARATSEG